METNLITTNEKNAAALIHASTFLKYFFPLANFFAPLLLWTFNKEKPFVDEHGKQAINFQLSILVYTIIIGLLCLPFFIIFATDFISLIEALDRASDTISIQEIKNISGYIALFGIAAILLFGLFVFELYCVINATMHAAKGKMYRYPFTISFLKTITNSEPVSEQNQPDHEHAS